MPSEQIAANSVKNWYGTANVEGTSAWQTYQSQIRALASAPVTYVGYLGTGQYGQAIYDPKIGWIALAEVHRQGLQFSLAEIAGNTLVSAEIVVLHGSGAAVTVHACSCTGLSSPSDWASGTTSYGSAAISATAWAQENIPIGAPTSLQAALTSGGLWTCMLRTASDVSNSAESKMFLPAQCSLLVNYTEGGGASVPIAVITQQYARRAS